MHCFRQYGNLALAFGVGLLIAFLMPDKIVEITISVLILILALMLMSNC